VDDAPWPSGGRLSPRGHLHTTQQIDAYGTSVAVTATLLYDAAGNLLSETTGQSTTASDDHHATTSYGYDALNRQTQIIERYRAGVFAAGDVRSGSVKRVASAVGEGAIAVQFVHEYLKEM
jgi:YD repeat-containing protein